IRVSVSVALLLIGLGSNWSARLIVAVLARLPVAAGLMVAVTVYVIVPPTGMKVTVSLMLPLPLASLPTTPAEPTLVQVAPVRVAGRVSATTTLVAALGPALVTTMV